MSSIFEYIQPGVYHHNNDVVGLVARRSGGGNDTRVPQIWAFTFFVLPLVTPFVAARFYVRLNSGIKTLGFDDFMILLALIAASICGAIGIWGATLGFGRHVWEIVHGPADGLYKLQIVVVLLPTIYQFSLACVQLSILTFYARFFKHLRCTAFIMMGIIVTFCCTSITGNAVHCRPKPEFRVSICEQLEVLWYFSSGIGLALDIIIWILPLPRLLKLKSLSRRRKIGIIATFGVGASAIIVSISRMAVIAVGATNDDKYWNMARLHIYNQVELGFGIACACMPSLMPLLRKYLIWKRGRGGGQRRNNAHPEHGIPQDIAIVLKSNVLESTYVERDSGLPANMRIVKNSLSSRDERPACISVADIRGCGILDSPTVPEDCLSRVTVQDQSDMQHMRRVGDYIELAPMASIAESTQVTLNCNLGNVNLPQQPPSAEIPNKRISIGSVPGARMIRRASSQFRDFLRPFSFERSRELWNSAPGGPGSDVRHKNDIDTDQFQKSSSNHTPVSIMTGRPPASSYSGEMMLLVESSNQQQQQHSPNFDAPEPQNNYRSNYTSSNSSIDTVTTDIQYIGPSTLHPRTLEAVHITPLSPRTSQLRETPWRDTIYPNPVEDQRGMLGLGDVDPVAGCILEIERVDTVDSQYMQRS